jgi:Arc/MetJ family transcription regulator
MHVSRETAVRTTIEIDRELLERVKSALGASTYREAVERALERVDRLSEIPDALDTLQGSDLSWDVEGLLEYRRLDRGDSR